MKLTLGSIASYLGGGLLVLLGLVATLMSPIGLAALTIGLLVLPPVRRRVADAGLEFSRGLTVGLYIIGVVLVLVAVVAGAGGGGDVANDSPDVETDTPQEEVDLTHSVGETFTVGDGAKKADVTVNGVDTVEYEDSTYVAVDVTVKNTGDESFDVSSNQFVMVDAEDREFEADRDAMFEASMDGRETLSFEQVHPGTSITGEVYYEVDPSGSDYRLRVDPVGIFSGSDSHFVDINVE